MTREQLHQLENDLWSAADNLRANSDLKASEYSTPVMGLIFLKFADNNYRRYEDEILQEYTSLKGGRRERKLADIAIEKCGFYLPDHARYDYLLSLAEEEDIAKAIKKAMESIAEYKPELEDVLPGDEYFRLTRNEKTRTIPNDLLKNFANIPADAGGDLFGQIYEYFLSKFALAEGQGGGEFFTPRSVVRLMVEIIEPVRGTVYDPACGSGGMFVQSAHFIEEHRDGVPEESPLDVAVYGQEKSNETVKLAKMNMAVNGLRGEIKQANSYYEDPYESLGKYDYVLANPPFNVDDVSLDAVEQDPRFNAYGVPRRKTKTKSKGKETVPNANYLWVNLFAASLNEKGRAGFVMANSASDARHSEAEIRQTLIEKNLIYAMLTLPSNMFYTVTLPATLWFLDRAKEDERILFIDARNIFTQIDRAHREFSEEQIGNIAVISRLRRGQREDFLSLIDDHFQDGIELLQESREEVEAAATSLLDLLDDDDQKKGVKELLEGWEGLGDLEDQWSEYVVEYWENREKHDTDDAEVDRVNTLQRELAEAFTPFFKDLHARLKHLDKRVRAREKEKGASNGKRASTDKRTKEAKELLENLHTAVKNAERCHRHILWLQERFPEARYEDVTGLCKLATQEEVKEQDYSLNPGRYVGVVIEEDGLTEEEFLEELVRMNQELMDLNSAAEALGTTISRNVTGILNA